MGGEADCVPVPVAANTHSWDWFAETQKNGPSLSPIVPAKKMAAVVYGVQGRGREYRMSSQQ